MSIQAQEERLTLVKENWQVVLDYHKNPPVVGSLFSDYTEYLAGIKFCEIPETVDYNYGYIDKDGWHYEDNGGSAKNPIDIYAVKKDHEYFVIRGADATSGTRFRVCTVATDIRGKTTEVAAMQSITTLNTPSIAYATIMDDDTDSKKRYYTNPEYNRATPFFRASDNGWLLIQKDNNYTTGLSCYVFDLDTPVPVHSENPVLDESFFNVDQNGVITLKSTVDKKQVAGYKTVPNTVNGITVTGLGVECFKGCVYLLGLTLPNTVTLIDDYALNSCSLREFTISSAVTEIGDYAFQSCPFIETITVPSTVLTFGEHVFQSCKNLVSAVIESPITIIKGTFNNCSKLESATIPDTVTNITDYGFYKTRITAIPPLTGLTNIGSRAFSESWLTGQVVIPNTVVTVSGYAFQACSRITSVVIPSSVTTINNYAFNNLSTIEYFELQGTTPPTLAASNAFTGTNDCPIYVPDVSVTAYQTANNWSELAARITGVSHKP